jgi:hypothetical protein
MKTQLLARDGERIGPPPATSGARLAPLPSCAADGPFPSVGPALETEPATDRHGFLAAYHAAIVLEERRRDRTTAGMAARAARKSLDALQRAAARRRTRHDCRLGRLHRRRAVFHSLMELAITMARRYADSGRLLSSRALVESLDPCIRFGPRGGLVRVTHRQLQLAVDEARELLAGADVALVDYEHSLATLRPRCDVHEVLIHFARREKPDFLEDASLETLRALNQTSTIRALDGGHVGALYAAVAIRDWAFHNSRARERYTTSSFRQACRTFGLPGEWRPRSTVHAPRGPESLADAFVSWALPTAPLRYDLSRLAEAHTYAWATPMRSRTSPLAAAHFLQLAQTEMDAYDLARQVLEAAPPAERPTLLPQLIANHVLQRSRYEPT